MNISAPNARLKAATEEVRLSVEEQIFPASGMRLVQSVRRVLEWLLSKDEEQPRLDAIELLEAHLVDFEANSPITEDLRPWQHLASDLSVALEVIDEASAARARELANRFRAIITMMSRNPLGELAVRPASRRVLDALVKLGGRAAVDKVREASGHSPTHLSNILKALRGHGLVADESDESDRRRKNLVLTAKGRALHDAAHSNRKRREVSQTEFVPSIQVHRAPRPQKEFVAHLADAEA